MKVSKVVVRVAARVLAVAITAMSLFVGVNVAHAATITTWTGIQPKGDAGTGIPISIQGRSVPDGKPLVAASAKLFMDGALVPRTSYTASILSWTVYFYYVPQPVLADGAHTFRVEVKDTAGKLSSYQWSARTVQPPAASWLSPAVGETVTNGRPDIRMMLSDNTPGTTMTVTGEVRWGTASGPVVATFAGSGRTAGVNSFALASEIAPGTYYLTATVTDAAGNAKIVGGPNARQFTAAAPLTMTQLTDCDGCHPSLRTAHPTPSTVDCAVCHAGYDGAHMEGTEDCRDCHTDGWHTNGAGTTVVVTSSCVSCHSPARPAVVQHTAASTASSHQGSCSGCHDSSLIERHAVTPDGSAYPYQCDLCHGSDDATVKGAIASGDTTCSACHTSGYHADFDAKHTASDPTCADADCHGSTSLADVHGPFVGEGKRYPQYADACSLCHANADPDRVPEDATAECGDCHGDLGSGHFAVHNTTVGSSVLPGTTKVCGDCHDVNLMSEHGKATASSRAAGCVACHPTPRSSITDFDPATCSQAGCHVPASSSEMHGGMAADHALPVPAPACLGSDCHAGDLGGIHSEASTATASGTRTGCLVCHSGSSIPASGACSSCHAGDQGSFHGDLAAKHTSAVTCIETCHQARLETEHEAHSLTCDSCHDSTDPAVRNAIDNGETACSACHGTDHATSAAFCLGCHTAADGTYAGSQTYTTTKHATTANSTLALTRYPGTSYAAGACANCHGSHSATTRATGNELCYDCHDAAGTTKPATYSYQGETLYANSAHASDRVEERASVTLSANGTGFEAWESATMPTPSSPGTVMGSSAKAGLTAADGARGVTALAAADGGFDYQMYRFKLSELTSEIGTLTVRWTGFGEEAAGYPVTVNVWNRTANGGAGGWQQITSAVMAANTPVTAALTTPASYADASGYVYVMASARNADAAIITSGPSAAGGVAMAPVTVSWGTRGQSSSWVEYGPTTSYGSTAGTSTLSTAHSIGLRASAGTYHYRVRSTTPQGEDHVSPDGTFTITGKPPVLTPVTSKQVATGTASVLLAWAVPDATAGPFTYRVHLWNATGYDYTSGWVTSTNMPFVLAGGTYNWTVEAIDGSGLNYGVSLPSAFSITYPSAALTPVPSRIGSGPTDIAFSWTAPTNGMSPYTYQLHVWGPGIDYTSEWGTASTITTTVPGAGNYYWQVATKDKDGTRYADSAVGAFSLTSFTPTAPVLTAVPDDGYMTGPKAITFQWTQPNAESAPFTYQVHVWDQWSSPTFEYTSGWLSTLSTQVTLDGDHNYQWTVQAKDKDGVLYPLQSSPGSFYLYYYNSGSCPFLYTWDGNGYQFEADEFAAGKLGLNTSKGFRRPNPLDYHVLENTPAEKDGYLEYKLVEEREETDYLDQIKLFTVDAPADRDVYVERSQAEGVGRFTTLGGVTHTVRKNLQPPTVTWVNTGQNVTHKVAASDGDYVVLNDDRNVDYDYQTLELDLGDVQDAPQTKLVIDGRLCIPTTIPGRQRSLQFGPQVKFEVQDAAGAWVAVPTTNTILPKPPEFTRPFVLDLSRVWISESRKVRFTYLYKTYIDSILLDTSADEPVTFTEVPLVSADLQPHGFNAKSAYTELYDYVYGSPVAPPKYMLPGNYTRFGEVWPLLSDVDDKFVIFGGGDELTLRFTPPSAPGGDVNREFLLLSDGYYKDLKQTIDHTVDPLPFAAMSNFPYTETEHYPDDAEHQAYQADWNTRYQDIASTAPLFVPEALTGTTEQTPAEGEEVHRSLNTDLVSLEQALKPTVLASSDSCGMCHAVHGAKSGSGTTVAAALKDSEPGVCTGTGTQPGCHASSANAKNGTNVLNAFQAGAGPSTHHDVYGTAAGKIVCSNCHNPHADTATNQFANPAAVGSPLPSASDRFRDASGRVYALVGAQHDGAPPVVSSLATALVTPADQTRIKATWSTNEASNGYVDYGPTTAYGSTANSAYSNYTFHYIPSLVFPIGTTWHYRVRSVDGLGNTWTSQDYVHRLPYTRLTAAPTVTGGTGGTPVTVTWTTLGACDTWVDYGPTTSYGSTSGSATFDTSHSVQLDLAPGTYHLRARSSRDIDSYTSSDIVVTVYAATATAPVLTPVPSNGDIPGPQNIAFSWTQPNATAAPFTYQLHVWDSNSSPTYDYTSSWLTTNTAELTLDGDHNYNWTVQAKDKDGTLYPLSSTGTFYLYYYSGGSGSCPFLYTWDGNDYRFESDEFAAGKLGLNTSKGFRRPNPLDYHVLATEPAEKDGALEYKLVEERAEVDYLDQVKLYTVDAPADREVWVERSQAEGVGRFTTLDAVIHTTRRDLQPPVSVKHVNTGQDVTAKVAAKDGDYLMLNEDRNVDYNYQTIELDLGDVMDAPMTKLVVDGRTCIPTSIAGRQRSLLFGPQVKFEVQDAAGAWKAVPTTNTILPKPPEFERPFVMNLSNIWISDSRKVRLTYLYKTYLDAILLDTSADVPVELTELPLASADLQPHGFNPKSSLSELYEYVYGEPASPPYYHLPGDYTKFGGVDPLLSGIDDKFVIFGGGDELTLRFTPPSATPANTNRRFLFLSDGYYKDLKQTIAHTVDPLPFAAMSNFPYSESEHYPDDADHQAYQAEWNTRYEDGPASQQPQSPLSSLMDGVDRLWAALVATVDSILTPEPPVDRFASHDLPDTTYSVDTDRIALNVLYTGSVTPIYANSGWQSASAEAAKPTPSAPGSAVDATALNNTTSENGVFWRTDLTTADRTYNWQMMRFDVSAGALTGARGLQLQWLGHGEPTAGYPVKMYLWDFTASKWVLASEGTGGSNFALAHTERQAGHETFCLSCHTAAPPAGASGAAALVNLSSAWDVDFHGEGAGTGGGTTLKAPYSRGNAAIGCDTCHDSHGNANAMHLKSTINGQTGIAVADGNQYENACSACHVGTVAQYHQQCDGCHYSEHGWGPEINESWDCKSCHEHGKVWVHNDIGCHCGGLPSARTF